MALVFNDRVKETSVTTGTGTLTLDGAVQGFETFSSAIGNSNTTFYAIELPGTTEFEVGRGTISAGQLARTEIISSSNSDSAVDFSAGTKIVFCTLPASKFVPGKFEGTNFTGSLLLGHSDSGTLSSAIRNTGIGIVSLDAITSGTNNTAIGYNSATSLTTGSSNTAIGSTALVTSTNSSNNTAIGLNSLRDATSSSNNTAVGSQAGLVMSGGSAAYNTVIGFQAGDNISSGAGNVVIGSVDVDTATGDRQLKIAGNDGSTTTTWISGDSAGALTFADKVVLAANKTIEFGDSGETISGDGTHLTIAGSDHINVNAQGELTLSSESNEIFFRDGSTLFLKVQRDGDFNANFTSNQDKKIEFIGNDGGSTVDMLVLDGAEAGKATFNSTITADSGKDVILGKNQGTNFTNSLLIGHNTTGTLNNANGNVGIGTTALDALVTADNNVAVGFGALSANASGNSNTALGQDSLAVNNSGSENTAVGARSSYLLANGTGNTTIGFKAGEQMNNADADYNILIGHQAGDNITEGAGNVIIGSVDAAAADGDRTLKIAGYDGSTTTTWISGDSDGIVTFADDIKIKDNGTIGNATTANAMTIEAAGQVTFVGDIGVGDDIFMGSNGALISLGATNISRIIHQNDGFIFKSLDTGDDNPFVLTLQTGETDIAANDVLGKIDFQAPDEGTGTDAILVAAGIEAVSEGDFSSSSNATKLSFKTAASEAASEKMSLSSAGNLTVTGTVTANGEVLSAGVSAGFAVAMAIAL